MNGTLNAYRMMQKFVVSWTVLILYLINLCEFHLRAFYEPNMHTRSIWNVISKKILNLSSQKYSGTVLLFILQY